MGVLKRGPLFEVYVMAPHLKELPYRVLDSSDRMKAATTHSPGTKNGCTLGL